MDTIAQIIAKISQIQSALIVTNGHNADSLSAALALRSFLKKFEKDVALISAVPVSDPFQFLPEVSEVKEKIDLTKSLVIDVSTKKSPVAELSYKKNTEKLSIYLKPSIGEFVPADVTFRTSNFPYELVILISISSLEHLGEFYSNNTGLFFDVPLVNIDFRASNENYGQFNLVQLTATSTSEIVLDLINKFEASLIDETIATQLLTGIIAETNSFQHVRTTPQTFLKAAQLVSLGARQQDIISHLYKTKSLGFLKLWGRVLARLLQLPEISLVYSVINQNDLVRSNATNEDAEAIIKEMASQLKFAKIFMFMKEDEGLKTTVYVHSNLPVNLANIFGQFTPQFFSPQTVKFSVNEPLASAEKLLTDLLQSEIGKIKPTA